MNRILVVEDEPGISSALKQALTESGYVCSVAQNGREGLSMAEGAELLVVDVMMPVMDGFAMVKELRSQGCRVPVIFLTARDRTADLVHGLDMGADDYLVKPFKLDELLARVRAVLRRARDARPILQWHDITVDRSSRRVFRNGTELFLSATEFSLLEMLVRNYEVVLSKDQILREVWHDEGYRNENIVELYINYLRRKSETNGLPRVIHTVRRKGYILAKPQP